MILYSCTLTLLVAANFLVDGQGNPTPDTLNLKFKSVLHGGSSDSALEKLGKILQNSFKKPIVNFLTKSRRKRASYTHLDQSDLKQNKVNNTGTYTTFGTEENDTKTAVGFGQNNESAINPPPDSIPVLVFKTHNDNATTTTIGSTKVVLTTPSSSRETSKEENVTDAANVSVVTPTLGSNVTDAEATGGTNSSNVTAMDQIPMNSSDTTQKIWPNSTEISTTASDIDITTNQDSTITGGLLTTVEPTRQEAKTITKRIKTTPMPQTEVKTEAKSNTKVAYFLPTSTDGGESEVFAQTRKPYVEPVPIWYEAKLAWGWAWEFHIYFVGLAFSLLTIYSVVSISRLWQKKQLLSQGFFIGINVSLAVMGLIRAVYFLVDAYNSHEVFAPDALDFFMYNIGFPCLTTAFSILFLALLQTTKVWLLSPRMQCGRVLLFVILAHLILSITTDVVVGSIPSARAMMFVCQLVSVMWGILLSAGYVYIYRTLYAAALRRQKDLLKLSLGKLRLPGLKPIHKPPRLTLGVGVKVTLATAVAGLLYSAMQIYAMVGVYGVFSLSIPAPWPWWGFKFTLRILELVMCFLMSYVATQPFRYQKRPNRTVCDCFCWAPCHAICEGTEYETKEDSIYWNEIHGVSVSYSQELDPSDLSRVSTAKYAGSPDESIPLSSEEDVALQKTRSNTMDSDYGDLDLGSGPIVLNPHVLYQRNPELLSLRDEPQNETKLDKNLPINMQRSTDVEEKNDDSKFISHKTENVSEQKVNSNRKTANRPASLKPFLPRSPLKGKNFLHSKPEQAGYSNLGDKTDQKKAPPAKRNVASNASSVRSKSHQGSNYLSLSDLENNSGVLDTAECKVQGQTIPTSLTIPEESENSGTSGQQGNLDV